MKAMPFLFAVSLAANLVLGWMLWQQHPVAPAMESPVVQSLSPDLDVPDLLATPAPLTVPPAQSAPLLPGPLLQPASSLFESPVEKPYAAPLPPNPHAFPSWEKRAPFRESQRQRGLYPASMKLDK